MSDTKILSAIRALHDRAFAPGWGKVELSRRERVFHIQQFIYGSLHDAEPPTWDKMLKYKGALLLAWVNNFSPKSLTHLNEIAKECLS